MFIPGVFFPCLKHKHKQSLMVQVIYTMISQTFNVKAVSISPVRSRGSNAVNALSLCDRV